MQCDFNVSDYHKTLQREFNENSCNSRMFSFVNFWQIIKCSQAAWRFLFMFQGKELRSEFNTKRLGKPSSRSFVFNHRKEELFALMIRLSIWERTNRSCLEFAEPVTPTAGAMWFANIWIKITISPSHVPSLEIAKRQRKVFRCERIKVKQWNSLACHWDWMKSCVLVSSRIKGSRLDWKTF